MILKDRKLERYQKLSKASNIMGGSGKDKEVVDPNLFNRLRVLETKQSIAAMCNMGFIPFCISSSHVTLTKRDFRTNYCMYYDNELCVAAISEGFGPFANDLSYICCRHAVSYLITKTLEPAKLEEIIEVTFQEIEKKLDQIESQYESDLDTLLTGCSLGIMILYKGVIASGIIGDARLLKLSQNLDGGKINYEVINEGLSMSSGEDKERIYWSHGEIRKNSISKECIYVKGREYPESPMLSCIGCRIGKEIGISSESSRDKRDRNSLFERQGILMLCNGEFYNRIAEDEENKKLLSCITINDANSIREYIYGKLKIQYLQKGNPIDDSVGLIFIMDKDTNPNLIQRG